MSDEPGVADRLLADQPELLARAREIRDGRGTGLVKQHASPARAAGDRRLTERQIDVLIGVAAGDSNAEIARDLFLSHHTVASHVKHALVILGARNRTHAVLRGFELGYLSIDSRKEGNS